MSPPPGCAAQPHLFRYPPTHPPPPPHTPAFQYALKIEKRKDWATVKGEHKASAAQSAAHARAAPRRAAAGGARAWGLRCRPLQSLGPGTHTARPEPHLAAPGAA